MSEYIADLVVTADEIRLTLADGRELATPVEWFPASATARPSSARLAADRPREGVHWPDLDEDIAAATLLRAG